MTDLNKERELYESVIEKTQGIKMEHLVGISFNAEANQYEISGEKWACELTDACEELNTGWFIWQECVKAKAQAVPTWIGVKDEEPPIDTMVLICWSDSPDVQPEIDYMTCDEDLNHIWANFYKDPPTHWMHFHKVPSESGAEQ
ncbi:hypothetical protein JEO87_06040 [Acinetobacter pittii]|uniref:DUF551 domain-containing protein n=1 Tax=Acinetobacter pittii TaxID=48296 RepID=A0AAE9M7U4_ACIPI|nr:hypothetical protein [Acinetobacter pittii]AZP30437.1 hypothetical protein DLK06_15905 [Acinetobacter pittii]MBK0410070.1 hypothetical protein [Acinetobacter pittii]MBK1416356.1 hypothetical protein [Acinetobacter pittii]USU93824.1 DUF551 domain-containing protein [Acinetobacter pittii]